MSNYIKGISVVVFAIIFSVGASVMVDFYYGSKPQAPVASGTTFNIAEGVPYYISSTVQSTDTTVCLSSFNSPSGISFTMSNFGSIGYATLDPNNLSRLETISFTGIQSASCGVQLTGVTRGIDFVSPYAASSTLAHTHLVGSTLILSNPAAFYGQQFAFVNATTTIGANWVFGSTTPPYYDQNPNFNNFSSTTFASIGYVASTSYSGTVNGTTLVKGIFQGATGFNQASSTVSGSTGANLVTLAANATDTPTSSCDAGYSAPGAGCSVIAQLTGYISSSWINFTKAFTVTGLWTFGAGFIDNASTTIAANSSNKITFNKLPYVFPTAENSSSTILETDGSGNLSWEQPQVQTIYVNSNINQTVTNSSTTLAFISIPANTLTTTNTVVRATFTYTFNSGNCYPEVDYGNGSATTTLGGWGNDTTNGNVAVLQNDLTIMATGTTAELSFNNVIGGNSPSTYTAFPAYNISGVTYLNVTGRCTSGSMTLWGGDVKVETH